MLVQRTNLLCTAEMRERSKMRGCPSLDQHPSFCYECIGQIHVRRAPLHVSSGPLLFLAAFCLADVFQRSFLKGAVAYLSNPDGAHRSVRCCSSGSIVCGVCHHLFQGDFPWYVASLSVSLVVAWAFFVEGLLPPMTTVVVAAPWRMHHSWLILYCACYFS